MKTSTKIWLIVAASLVLIGLVMFHWAMTKTGWNFTKLSTVEFETNRHEISEEFRSISINTDTADIIFKQSGDGKCTVECYEGVKEKHTVSVNDGTLVINANEQRVWYDHIGIQFSAPKLTIYLPETELEAIHIKEHTGDIKIHNISINSMEITTSTGDITLSNITCAGDLKTNVSTGDVNLTDITCSNLSSTGDTGDISLKNVIATETFLLKRSTGDVKFNDCDAEEITVETSTGDVSGSLLTQKVFITNTSTGDIHVPKTDAGGKCKITTSTGDIHIDIS